MLKGEINLINQKDDISNDMKNKNENNDGKYFDEKKRYKREFYQKVDIGSPKIFSERENRNSKKSSDSGKGSSSGKYQNER